MMVKFPLGIHATVVFTPYVISQPPPARPINNNEQVRAREKVQPSETVGYDGKGFYKRTMGGHVVFVVA